MTYDRHQVMAKALLVLAFGQVN